MSQKLKQSIAIFKELGWEKATPGNFLDLPLGTPEQRKQALEGLKSGHLGDFVADGRFQRWGEHYGVSLDKLILFAIRIGVTPARAKTVLSYTWNGQYDEAKAKAVISRGENFAAAVAKAWYVNNTEGTFRDTPVRLVYELNLDPPQNIGYFIDWAMIVADVLRVGRRQHHTPDRRWLTRAMAESRFEEHILAALAVNTPLTHIFGQVTLHGITRSLISRETIIPHIFTALDAAIRPADRKALLGVLDELNITDEELAERTQALIPLLATSDTIVINRLAPPLMTHADDDILTEVMLSAFSATTKKTRLLVLKSAQARSCPPNAEGIAPWLSMLSADKDKTIAAAATKLIKIWNIEIDQPETEETEIQDLWQNTPPLWEVPAFEPGEITQDNLTECLAEIYERQGENTAYDIAVERLLTIAVALAYNNAEDVRMALAGLKTNEWWGSPLLHYLSCWSKGENLLKSGWSSRQPLTYRDRFVAMNLGTLPCLLSAPSKIDLSITVPDLTQRLVLYNSLGIAVLDSDLLIALTRLDTETKTPEAVKLLESLSVEVKKPNQGLMRRVMIPVNACEMVLKYLNDPTLAARPTSENLWQSGGAIPKSLNIFNIHLPDYGVYAMFPSWGDVALKCVSWNYGYHSHSKGHMLRQVARRRDPLPPGAAINMLGAQRSSSPQASEDTALAVSEAWERGLLCPGVPDIALLDWREKGPPSNLAALVTVLESLAREGMLSLVWPILDGLIAVSLKEPRLLSGTAELAEAMAEFMPEVLHAIKEGNADDSALNLPGIRELATRSGTSKAVTAAKKVAAQLPAQPVTLNASTPPKKAAPEMTIPFDKIWPKPASDTAIIEDGVEVKITLPKDAKNFLFTLTLCDGKVLHITDIWPYDIQHNGICTASTAEPGASALDFPSRVFLHWDQDKQTLVVNEKKDDRLNSRLKSKPKLSMATLVITLALTAQSSSSYTHYYTINAIKSLAKKEGLLKKDSQINPPVVKKAMETILQNPDVSPAKIARIIEKELHLLPSLWPVLTESVRFAGAKIAAGEKAPQWLNRILDISLRYAPYLAEAAKRGYIADAKWPGLSDIARANVKSTAIAKAGALLEML